jgi:hypothetical protein
MSPMKYTIAVTSPVEATITATRTQIQLPLIFRFHFGNVLSLGAGAYYGIAQGKVKLKTEVAGLSSEEEQTYSEIGYSTSNIQGVGSLRLNFGGKTMGFLLEGQYLMGLKNISTGSSKVKTNGIQFLGGVSFML